MSWSWATSKGNEAAKVKDSIAFYLQGKGLDLGCGGRDWKIIQTEDDTNSCIGVDINKNADVVANLADLSAFADEHFDYIFSSHALEDFFYTEALLKIWWEKVKVGGYFILYLPLTRNVAKDMGLDNWQNFYPNMKEEGSNKQHRQDLDPRLIKKMVENIAHAELVVDEIRGDGDEYSFLLVYRKTASCKLGVTGVSVNEQKRALMVRLGAAGDNIQCSMVPRLLKERGYHVTVSVSGYGAEVFKHNPYIDELVFQWRNQVPPTNLGKFWADVARRFDLFVNLTGSTEDTLLIPDRVLYDSMDALRQKAPSADDLTILNNTLKTYRKLIGDRNYYDAHIEKAGLPERGLNGELYFSFSEELPAVDFRQRYKDKFLIMWSLAGSSYHKWYPWFDQVVTKVLADIPEAVVISVGDEACQLMERVESARYFPRAGKWAWRRTLVMTKYVDLVVGPETGVLNASGCFDTPKITLLSHSSHANFCKYFKNDYCLAPEGVFCHPCHVLHYTHVYDQHCAHCDATHKKPDELKFSGTEEEAFGDKAFWSCPYDEMPQMGTYPICQARGIPAQRVIDQIKKVYQTHWLPMQNKEMVTAA